MLAPTVGKLQTIAEQKEHSLGTDATCFFWSIAITQLTSGSEWKYADQLDVP